MTAGHIIPSRTSAYCGHFSILLGSIVIIGWVLNNPLLIQIFSHYVPMQFNTAIGFILAGMGLTMANSSNIFRVHLIGTIIFCLGAFTLFEYLFTVNFGLDQLFFSHYITIATSHPGRMAPNTAICFIVTGMGLVSITQGKSLVRYIKYSAFSGGILSALGFVALVGYMVDIKSAYGWGQLTPMAIHTAIGFILIGSGFIAFSWKNEANKISGTPTWLPLLIKVWSFTLTVSFTKAYETSDNPYLAFIIFNIGFFLGALCSLTIYFKQKYQVLSQEFDSQHQGLLQQTKHRIHAEENLQHYRSKLTDLKNRLQDILENEKLSTARHIHDELSQSLTGIKMGLYRIREESSKDNPFVNKEADSLIYLVDHCFKSIQNIAMDLRPIYLEEMGLWKTIQWQANEFQNLSGIKCYVTIPSDPPELDSNLSTALYRILQEALSNVYRHAKAKSVRIILEVDPDHLLLEIGDDGIGIRSEQVSHKNSLGIMGIRERVLSLNGEVSIQGGNNKGTLLQIKIPHLSK